MVTFSEVSNEIFHHCISRRLFSLQLNCKNYNAVKKLTAGSRKAAGKQSKYSQKVVKKNSRNVVRIQSTTSMLWVVKAQTCLVKAQNMQSNLKMFSQSSEIVDKLRNIHKS